MSICRRVGRNACLLYKGERAPDPGAPPQPPCFATYDSGLLKDSWYIYCTCIFKDNK